MIGGVNTPLLSGIITGNKKLGINTNPLNLTNTFEVNSPISDAVKINSNTNSTNLELMNSGGSVFIKSGNKNMTLQTDTTALVYLKGDVNKVGILTMNPQQALQVAGTIRVDSLVNNLTPDKLVGANNSNDLTDIKIGNGLSFLNDTLKVADNIINSGDTATLLRQDFLGINTNVLTWQQGSKKLLPYFTQVYRNGQLLKSESQYTITNDSIVTLSTGSYKLDDNITIIAIDNIVALAGSGGMITLQGDVTGSGTSSITTTIGVGKVTNSMLAGSITNDKLDVITATNKVSNSATTATNLNTNNAIVSRDASGNFSAGTITASLNGNANTVTTNANLTGDVTSTGNATSIATGVIVNADINASAAIAVSKLAASTISGVTLGNNLNTLTISSPLTGTSYNGSSAVSIGIPAATGSVNGYLSSTDWTTFNNKQSQLNGTGFVKASGTSITYDNSSYLPLTGGTLSGSILNSWTSAYSSAPRNDGAVRKTVTQNLYSANGGTTDRVTHYYTFSQDECCASTPVTMYYGRFNGFYNQSNIIYDASIYYHNNNQFYYRAFSEPENKVTFSIKPSTTVNSISGTKADLYLSGDAQIDRSLNIGTTLSVTGATNISNTLSTTSYAALDAGNNTHRLTNTLSGNQTWTPSAGFLTSYFNNNVSGGWYYNTSVDNSGFPILSILSTSNDRKKAGITLNSQGTANGTYSPAITFSSLSNSTSYYSAYAAIIGKKTGVGGASGSDANWNTGHIEFYGTTQATDVNGGVMLNSPSMTLGLGVGIGYDAPPTIKGRLIVSEKIGINQSTPNFALDVSGTANITGATTIGTSLAVTGNITEGGNNVLTNLDTASLSSRIDSKFNSSGGTISGAVTLSTTTAVPTVLLGKDGSNVVGELNIGGGLVTVGSNLLAIKPFYSADNSTGIIYASGFMNTVSTVYQKITQNSTVTITLPSAVGYAGRSFVVKNLGTGAVISNASNVEPFNSATLGTAILPSGGGKWARLVSDGTNWVIMEAN